MLDKIIFALIHDYKNILESINVTFNYTEIFIASGNMIALFLHRRPKKVHKRIC